MAQEIAGETLVWEAPYSSRVRNALERGGVRTVAEARALGEHGLSRLWGMGRSGVHEVLPELRLRRRTTFSAQEVDLLRQWYDAVVDLNPKYLEQKDHALAKRLYEVVGIRVPNSLAKAAGGGGDLRAEGAEGA